MGFSKVFSVITVVLLGLCVSDISSASFPVGELDQCDVGDNACLAKITEHVITSKQKGLRNLGLVPIEPLQIDKMDIVSGNSNSPVSIVLNFKDILLSGISRGKVLSVKGFEEDFDGKKVEIKARFDGPVTLAGDYKINGKVLILPIQGTGKCNLTLNAFDFTIKLLPKAVTKDGKVYLQMEKAKSSIQNVKRLYLNFQNLFNGDRLLGDNMNVFLNENWKEIFEELRPSVEGAFANIFKNLVNQVFTTLPYRELFKP